MNPELPSSDDDLKASGVRGESLAARIAVVIGVAALAGGAIVLLRAEDEAVPPPLKVEAKPAEPEASVVAPAPAPTPPMAESANEPPSETPARVSRDDVINAIKLGGADEPAIATERDRVVAKKKADRLAREQAIAMKKKEKKRQAFEKRLQNAARQLEVEDDASEWEARPEGGLSEAEFHTALVRWDGVKTCLLNHKKRNSDATGSLRLRLKIAGSGQVEECRVFHRNNELEKVIAPCVQQEAKTIKFPPFPGTGSIVRNAVFLF
jgi:hypothetical protein